MEFKDLKIALQENFKRMTKDETHLFEVDLDKDELWNLYLDSFPAGTNEIYKERREFDCSCCRHFIKNIGNAVIIKNNEIHTIWDFKVNDTTYQPVINALSAFIKSKTVTNMYISKFNKIGTDKNLDLSTNSSVLEWHHFYLELPDKFVDRTQRSAEEIKGCFRDTRNVFKRSLEELTQESVLTVLELISQNSLYKGEEWKAVLTEFLKYKKQYDKLPDLKPNQRDNYAWEQSAKAGAVIARIRNHSIGTLLINISENMDLDEAVKKYEAIVAPTNYKRPKAIFTAKMLEDAKNTSQELGFMDSLARRHATLDDITVNNILFSNKDSAKRITGDVFDDMSKDVAVNPKKFSKVEEISVDDFITSILPTSKEIEVYFENKHANSMVSLIAPENKDSKIMFKWNNRFSWAYSGNITDSSMKHNVKSAGGNVEGVLRFSIQWNDVCYDGNDLDAHCHEPNGNLIYYGSKHNHSTTGQLDIDIIHPQKDVPAVENITWTDISKMQKGTYRFLVHNFNHNGGKSGFRAEIEFDGQIFSFNYTKELKLHEKVDVAEVTFDGNTFTIKEKLPHNVSSREVWNLKTNQFVPVSVVMFSPNYWDDQNGIGHRHYFFMLKDCINSESPNGFYNEFLQEDLMKHKRVFEALGSKMSVKDVDDQLSGIGFSSTKRNELIVKVKGQLDRMLKIKF